MKIDLLPPPNAFLGGGVFFFCGKFCAKEKGQTSSIATVISKKNAPERHGQVEQHTFDDIYIRSYFRK